MGRKGEAYRGSSKVQRKFCGTVFGATIRIRNNFMRGKLKTLKLVERHKKPGNRWYFLFPRTNSN
jgi:hypothetical protein